MDQTWSLVVTVIVALIMGAGGVLGTVLPVILKDRRSREELLARTETSNGVTIGEMLEEINERMAELATKTDVERVEHKLEEHAEGFGHPKLAEMISEMARRRRR